MIRGENRPNGYFVTSTGQGHKVEGETFQCVHCQFIWVPKPGSGIRRGYCFKHSGMICGRQECIDQQRQWTGNRFDCLTIEEYNNSVRDQVEKTHKLGFNGPAAEVMKDGKIKIKDNFKLTDSGIAIPI